MASDQAAMDVIVEQASRGNAFLPDASRESSCDGTTPQTKR